MNLELTAPNYSTLSRRSKNLVLASSLSKYTPTESITVIVDSSGLKIYGQGEWDAKKHGLKKRRHWCKIHLCIDEGTLEIVSFSLTTDETGDSTEVPKLLDEINNEVDEFIADGAYDGDPVYNCVKNHSSEKGGKVTVPPRSNATLSRTAASKPTQRDKHVRFIEKHGRIAWERYMRYSRRLLVENTMYRYKTIIGRHMRARDHSS